MTLPDHLKKGRWGEDYALRYVKKLGWKVLDRNVRFKTGELDIVAVDGDELVVVEVRLRSVGIVLPPDRTVGPRKLAKLVRSGSVYVEKNNWHGFWRIDLIALTLVDDKVSLEHCRDITGGDVVC